MPSHIWWVPPRRTLIGRQDVLDDIRNRLLGEEHDAALLNSLPGAGKTALAVAAAYDEGIRAGFPDGVLWLPVGRAGDLGLAHWSTRMERWAKELGAKDDDLNDAVRRAQSHDYQGLCALVHNLLGTLRVLLIFDDVWEVGDGRAFRQIGSNCRRLLTTRIPDVAEFFDPPPVRVAELDATASRVLLLQHFPEAPQVLGEQLDRVVDALAGLPLSVVLVGNMIGSAYRKEGKSAALRKAEQVLNPDERLKIAVKYDLDYSANDNDQTLRNLETLLSLATDSLEGPQIDALRALAAFPPKANTFSREAGDYVVQDPRHITAIVNQTGLLELLDPLHERFTMHQAVNDFARHARQGDVEAYRRLANYFISYVDRQVKSESDDEEWLQGIEIELQNIRAVIAWAKATEERELGLQIVSSLWPYWYKRNRFTSGLDMARQVLDIPEPVGGGAVDYQLLRAKVFNDAGNLAYNMAQLRQAEDFHRSALGVRLDCGRQDLAAGSWNNLALIARERGELDYAEQLLHKARRINEGKDGNALWLAMNLNNLGLVAAWRSDFVQAVDYQKQSELIFERENEVWGVAMTIVDRAESLLRLGEIKESTTLLAPVLEQRFRLGDYKRVAAALRVFGEVALLANDVNTALDRLLVALKLSAPLMDRLGESRALAGIIEAAKRAERDDLCARAKGSLDAYFKASGATLPDREIDRLNLAVREVTDRTHDFSQRASRAAATAGIEGGADRLTLSLPLRSDYEDIVVREVAERVKTEAEGGR